MQSSDDPWDKSCPNCGAKMHRQARDCWLCGGDVNVPAKARPARPPRYTSLAEVFTGMTLVIGVAAMLAAAVVAGFAAFAAVCTGILSVGPH